MWSNVRWSGIILAAFQSCLVVSITDSDGQRRRHRDTKGQFYSSSTATVPWKCSPTVMPTFRCCGPTSPRSDTATILCWWTEHSYWSAPPGMSFPACSARHRRSGRRSVCQLSCGWCSCGSSSASLCSVSRSSSWVCSCTGPNAWLPARVEIKQSVWLEDLKKRTLGGEETLNKTRL